MASKRFLQFHLLPFIIAVLVLALLSFSPFSSSLISFDKGEIHSKDFQQNYKPEVPPRFSYADLASSFSDEEEVMDYWLPQRPVVVVGSSEMTHWKLPSMPYNFFNQHGVPCIGIGHAGNQCLCVLSQLALMHNYLDSMRLVIILSPGWFEDKSAAGTPLETFLEYNDEHFLYYLENDKAVPADVKTGMENYVANHLKDIDAPSSILRLMAYQDISKKSFIHSVLYSFHTNLLSTYCENKNQKMNNFFLEGKSSKPFTNPWNGMNYLPEKKSASINVNWDSLENKALADFALTCTNNKMGVENDYFNEWMTGKPLKIIKPVESADNQEFGDLLLLLSFLKKENCKPIIVMQPLNPLCYRNLSDMDPLLTEIGNLVKKNGFEYLDLTTSDQSKYKIGMLSDFQHFGEYGWYLVDQKINTYFFKK